MTGQFVAMVQADRVGALQPLHPGHQVGVWSFKDQMVMIAHEAEGVHLPVGLLASLAEGLEETYETLPTSETSRPKCG